MANSIIQECVDCGENFCLDCDLNSSQCSGCQGSMCEACAEIALDERSNRCYTCADPDLATVRYPAQGSDYKLYKKYTKPMNGRLRD